MMLLSFRKVSKMSSMKLSLLLLNLLNKIERKDATFCKIYFIAEMEKKLWSSLYINYIMFLLSYMFFLKSSLFLEINTICSTFLFAEQTAFFFSLDRRAFANLRYPGRLSILIFCLLCFS